MTSDFRREFGGGPIIDVDERWNLTERFQSAMQTVRQNKLLFSDNVKETVH